MEILRESESFVLCVKPAGILSTDEPGGMPSLVRDATGQKDIRTVHRLDRVTGGLMVMAKGKTAAALLGQQIADGRFQKSYLAVVHGVLSQKDGCFRDLLLRDTFEKKTYVTDQPGKGVQEAILDYRLLGQQDDLSLVHITLQTGRTHQIRVQFSSRGHPLVGDRKYGTGEDDCPIALWSHSLSFFDPFSQEPVSSILPPPDQYPWDLFNH